MSINMSSGKLDADHPFCPSSLVCAICQEVFDGTVMVSKCGHSFCCDCLASYIQSRGSQRVPCPTCRTETTQFFPNFALQHATAELSEIVEKQKPDVQPCTKSLTEQWQKRLQEEQEISSSLRKVQERDEQRRQKDQREIRELRQRVNRQHQRVNNSKRENNKDNLLPLWATVIFGFSILVLCYFCKWDELFLAGLRLSRAVAILSMKSYDIVTDLFCSGSKVAGVVLARGYKALNYHGLALGKVLWKGGTQFSKIAAILATKSYQVISDLLCSGSKVAAIIWLMAAKL